MVISVCFADSGLNIWLACIAGFIITVFQSALLFAGLDWWIREIKGEIQK